MHRRLCLKGVPILVFHSVRQAGVPGPAAGADLALDADTFAAILGALARGGYTSIRCRELHAHLESGAPLPPRPILLSFDDGYLDNHTVAGPLLRRHGFQAAVFVATGFLEADGPVRPTLEEHPTPPQQGWLRPAELRAMAASGTFEIQAHSVEHAILPAGPWLADWHRPEAPCLWRARLERPERRPFEEQEDWRRWLPWGTPVWTSRWGGAGPAWIPEAELEERLQAFVAGEGGADFFRRADWRRRLEERLQALGGPRGRHETPEEFHRRLLEDLAGSRRRLEEILEQPVEFLAWPGGAACPASLELALDEAGFRATFLTSDLWPGVARDARAIPRAFFGQEYRGRRARGLLAFRARGVADLESGRPLGRLRVLLANRLMALLGRRPPPRDPGGSGRS